MIGEGSTIATLTNRFLTLNMNTKHNHPRLDLVKHVGVYQPFIPRVNIIQTITDLYFGG